MKRTTIKLLFLAALLFSIATVVLAVICAPPIPRIVTKMNARESDPLRDTIVVKCTGGENSIKEGATLTAKQWGYCPGYNVESKIRWDFADNGHGVTVVASARQIDGDLREINRGVRTWTCLGAPGWEYEATLVSQPCESPNGEADNTFQQLEITQDDCEFVGWFWNFTNTTCNDTPQTQLQCDSASWYWSFTNNTCGSEPAIGMCGGGPDWGSYPSTGCYMSGLGIYGGICNRSNAFISRCDGDYDNHYCGCTGCDWCGGSPIVISTGGDQFDLTDVAHGTLFDLNANGTRDKISWTAQNSDEAWLALDRNHNGVIDSGKELFGNFTFQTEPAAGVEKNGFLALAEYDKPENGGNNDGVIDANDAVFSHLRLWRDANQNGISEASELTSLSDSQIESISLSYRESRRTDRYGNVFRYRAKVYGPQHSDLGLWAYDVFLKSAQ